MLVKMAEGYIYNHTLILHAFRPYVRAPDVNGECSQLKLLGTAKAVWTDI